jgi:hypothetical protein
MRVQKPKVIRYIKLRKHSGSHSEDRKYRGMDFSQVNTFALFLADTWETTSLSKKTSFTEQNRNLLCLLLGLHEIADEAEFTIVKCSSNITDDYIDTVRASTNYLSVHSIEALVKDGHIVMENVYLDPKQKQLHTEIIISQILGELFKEELKNTKLTCIYGEIHKFIFILKFK